MRVAENRFGDDRLDRFRVEPWLDAIGGLVARRPGLWRSLGDLETRRLSGALAGIEPGAPIFVCGLARSGTTILLECLASHPHTATHRYRDYPGVLAPIVWNRIAERLYAGRRPAVERAHGDGIAITPDSPEAVEEMLWMAFYRHLHDPECDNRVVRGGLLPGFAEFYRDHIRKLLWLRDGRRYVSKANYNLARLGALIELFPDARFIVPIRDPVTHIASLIRQQALFSAGERRHRAALRYMQRIGHFEFGLDRRPVNVGNGETTSAIRRLWDSGREIEGWSLYWADLHAHLADRLDEDRFLRRATLLVPFETFCADAAATIERIFSHSALPANRALTTGLARRIRAPDRRGVPFDDDAVLTIRRMTHVAADRLRRLCDPAAVT